MTATHDEVGSKRADDRFIKQEVSLDADKE